MRRRPIGIGALQRDKERLELYQQKGSSLAKEELTKLQSQMKEFKTHLEKFAQKHRSDIKKNGEFRRYFQQMCATTGVDPLKSSTNYWVKLLGIGDFYFELAIQINEVFIATSNQNGGIMRIEELYSKVLASRSSKSDSITHEDILEGIKKLKVLGANIKILPTKNSYIIHATPQELNSDQTDVVQLANQNNGCISKSLVASSCQWSSDRVDKVLDELLMENLVWIDLQDKSGEPLYWVPFMFNK